VEAQDAAVRAVEGVVRAGGEMQRLAVQVGERLGVGAGRVDALVQEVRVEDVQDECLPHRVVDEADALDVEGLLDGHAEEHAVARVAQVGLAEAERAEALALCAELPDVRRTDLVAWKGLVEQHALELAGVALHAALVVLHEAVLERGLLKLGALALGPAVQFLKPRFARAFAEKANDTALRLDGLLEVLGRLLARTRSRARAWGNRVN